MSGLSPLLHIPSLAQSGSGTRGVKPAGETRKALVEGDYYALLIAVQDYDHPGVNDLDQPINDARNLKHVLTEQYAFGAENVRLVENPTRTQLVEAFDHFQGKLRSSDSLLVFYAGHGYWDKDMKQGYWLPSDAAWDSRVQWLSNSTIRDYIKGTKAKHTLLITDACFSGGIFKTRGAFGGASRAIQELYKLPSRKAITSGTSDKEVPDDSVFMQFLLKRLSQNEDPYLPAGRLFASFREAVVNNAPVSQAVQAGL